MLSHLRTLQQVSRRTLFSSAPRRLENKVPEKQKLFQEDNDVPIHLKGGIVDELLYRLTMGLAIFGTIYMGYVMYGVANPKKK
ncbi:hypothetical protein DNTS_015172 [Danionella cerebrum]|uniref:Cytochrome c oxidase subunit 7A2, mitochondrial n=1 Tax=Danionella cerebrum TaxID=2873325 RepID=A0A553RQA4_9TELE|nr:hypothetical protein DNTS_015172 [Danionella translucida]